MSVKISHRGLFTGGGTPFALKAAIAGIPGQPANYAHYEKLVKRTTVPGECDLADGVAPAIGPIVDVSPKGDSATVETKGYEWVRATAGLAVGDIVTSVAGGTVAKIAAAVPSDAERLAGCWQVDEFDATAAKERVLIQIDARV